MTTIAQSTDRLDEITGDLPDQVKWFARYLRRKNLAAGTVRLYVRAASDLAVSLAEKGMPTEAAKLNAEYVEAYLDSLWDSGVKAATVANKFRSLQQFCVWLEKQGEVPVSPMARMHPPTVPEKPIPVVPDVSFSDLIRSVRKSAKDDRLVALRDEAILRLFADTGMRLKELADLTVADVDFDTDEASVLGKGRRFRICPFDDDTATAIHKYLRERAKHPHARAKFINPDDQHDPRNGQFALWLGERGALTDSGIRQMVWRRSTEAFGREGRLHPHQLRHTAAHAHAKAGMSETEMMRLFGWKSDAMPKRYGASAADERARAAKKSKGLGNRFDV